MVHTIHDPNHITKGVSFSHMTRYDYSQFTISRGLLAELFSHVTVDSLTGCWLWSNGTEKRYGTLYINRKCSLLAHRLMYTLFVGPIPETLQCDHLCRVRRCANPAHIEPVTPAENYLRGGGVPAKNARKTHCKRGHLLQGENVYYIPKTNGNVWRACNVCKAERGKTATYKGTKGSVPLTDHCSKGHPRTEANTRLWVNKRGFPFRICRVCARLNNRKLKAAKKAPAATHP